MQAQPYLATALTILVMDAVWLTLRYQYHKTLFQSIQQSELRARLVPAAMIYVLLPFAIYLWAIRNQSSIQGAVANGALVGAILYGFYDLTNYATLTKWTFEMALTDTLWGTFVCAVGAGVGFSFLARK